MEKNNNKFTNVANKMWQGARMVPYVRTYVNTCMQHEKIMLATSATYDGNSP